VNIRFMWKDTGSGGGGCPALMETLNEEGQRGYCVVGKKTSPAMLAQAQEVAGQNDAAIAEDEYMVWVPANVLDRLRDAG